MIGGGTAPSSPKPMWGLGLSVGKVWVAGVAKQYMIIWRNDWLPPSHCVEGALCRVTV